MTQTWSVGVQYIPSTGETTYRLMLREAPFWVAVVENGFESLCTLTGGWLGGHGLPEPFWRIPVGRPARADDGLLVNSVASRLMDLESAVVRWAHRRWKLVADIEITPEEVRQINPEFFSIFCESE